MKRLILRGVFYVFAINKLFCSAADIFTFCKETREKNPQFAKLSVIFRQYIIVFVQKALKF